MRKVLIASCIAGCCAMVWTGVAASASAESARVILLGSGTPIPDPESFGPAVAVVVNGQAYLFDAGAGVVRRAVAAAEKYNLQALEAPHLTRLFFTHLHSDHTIGYPDVMLTPWVVGRYEPLEVYGPKGVAAMTEHLKEAYQEDIAVRTEGREHLGPLQVGVHEIEAGLVYKDQNVSIRAFGVKHGSWKEAFGYAIDAGTRRIVLSGDTAPTDSVVEACHGCDVLLHEVYSDAQFRRFPANARGYHSTFHTSTKQLAEIAQKAKPKLLVLYHQLYFAPKSAVDLVAEVKSTYTGAVVNGEDLGIY